MRRCLTPSAQSLPEVTISEDAEVRFLHLGTEWIQGSMLIDAPFDIELEYVQRMMAWLLFVDPDSVASRRACSWAWARRR
jgi:spermidine synthase